MSYLAINLLQPQTFIFSSNADALVVQSIKDESKIALINATASNTLDPIFYLSANRNVFHIEKNSNVIAQFDYLNQEGYLNIPHVKANRISLSNQSLTIEKDQQQILTALYDTQAKIGIGTTLPTYALEVVGDVYATKTVYASNLVVYGETIIIDAVTSNSEQVYITNEGTGPALKVIQTGPQPIAEFYDDENISLLIADGGLIGINTSYARQLLDVNGDTIISGFLGIGTTQPATRLDVYGDLQLSGNILQNGSNYFEVIFPWKYEITNSNNLYVNVGNIGIGTNIVRELLDVNGNILYNQQIISATTTLAPFIINSTSRVDNLNVEYLDGYNRSYYENIENLTTGILRILQGGTGSNYVTPNKLLVGHPSAIRSPHELHWDGRFLGINTSQPQQQLHISGNLQIENSNTNLFLVANQQSNLASITLNSNLVIHALCNEFIIFSQQHIEKVKITPTYTNITNQLFTNGNIGIGSIYQNPEVSLAIYTTDAVLLPKGTTAERPAPQLGYIRYNNDSFRFEGYASNQWEALNKLESISRTSYILPEQYPGRNDNTIYFYTSNQQQIIINEHGNLGIGTTLVTTSFQIHKTDSILIPKGTTVQRPIPEYGMIRFNTDINRFEGYSISNYWNSLDGLISADQLTYITTELTPGNNDSNIRFYTGGILQAILDLNGNLGIGTTLPQEKLDISENILVRGILKTDTIQACNLSASNFTVLQNFYYAPENLQIRNNYQINPTQYTTVLTENTSNFNITVDGLYHITPQKTHVFINGAKLAYNSPNEKDYDISYVTLSNSTLVTVTLIQNAEVDDIIDIYVYPSYLDPNGLLQPGYSIQNINYSYWQKLNAFSSNIYYNQGNVGIGTTISNSTFYVEGTSLFSCNIGIGTTLPQYTKGLYVTNGPIRALGPVIEGQQNIHRIDLGVLNNTPRQVFENKDATIYPIYQIDVENDGGSGVFRWYIPGTTLIQLSPTANRISPDTYIGSASITPVNTLDIANNLAVGTYAGSTTAQANSVIVSGFVGIGTTFSKQKLDVFGNITVSANVGIGTSLPTYPLHVIGNSYMNGNLGIGTTVAKEQLDVQRNIYVSGNIGFGTQPITPIDIYVRRITDTIGNAITITTATNDVSDNAITGTAIDMKMLEDSGPLTITSLARIAYGNRQGIDLYGSGYENNGILLFQTASAGTLNTNMIITGKGFIGIGTTLPRQKLEVTSGHFVISGNVGINTITPLYALHTEGNAYVSDTIRVDKDANFYGNIGIGTTLARVSLDVIGNSFISGNVGINTSSVTNQLDIIGTQYISNRLGINTNIATSALDVRGVALISSNVGIGTLVADYSLHVIGDAYMSGNVGIGTTIARSRLDIDEYTFIAGNIGIGTTLPQQRLHVTNDATIGRIGIGTLLPRETLDIIGNTIQQGFVGINTTQAIAPLHIYSSDSIVTVNNGKLAIAKTSIHASTDLEIRNSSNNTYSGILIRNNGNLYPTASLRIQSHHFDNNSSPSYAANIGLSRYNNNTYITNQTSLGAIHFGGNHTDNTIQNIAYTASIQAIAEADFLTSNNANIGLAFFTGSNSYQFYDETYTNKQEVLRLTASANVGIRTSQPNAIFEINGSNSEQIPFAIYSTKAILLPVGSNLDRPIGQLGYIRYNTEFQQFEGYGPGDTWGSLGGIRSVSGDTYILPEYTPGNNDQALHFYTASLEQMILNNNGNLGIGTLSPQQKLHVEGNIYNSGTLYTSNLEVFGAAIIINAVTSNSEQVVITNNGTGPALKVTQTGDNSIAEFYDGDFHSSQVSLIVANNGYVGINTYTPRERLDILGNTIIQGNVGIGTTIANYGLHIYDNVAIGLGLKQEGPYHIQEKWDEIGTTHIIPFPKYCVVDDSSGTLHVQVKSVTSKLGNISLSYLKQTNSNVDIFSIYYHKTNNLATMTVTADTSNIKVLTDADCKISWTAIGAC
jgi:hypothetical protein